MILVLHVSQGNFSLPQRVLLVVNKILSIQVFCFAYDILFFSLFNVHSGCIYQFLMLVFLIFICRHFVEPLFFFGTKTCYHLQGELLN